MREVPEGILAETIEDCRRCKHFSNNQCDKFGVIEGRFVCGAIELTEQNTLSDYYKDRRYTGD